MRVWIDCEFTDLRRPLLISVGLAAENGRELYVELAEGQRGYWTRESCSEFVVDVVLPLLDQTQACSAGEAGRRVSAFLAECAAGGRAQVHADYSADLYLVRSLLLDAKCDYELHDWLLHPLGLYGQSVADDACARPHHALDDARAYRAGRLAEETALRSDFPR